MDPECVLPDVYLQPGQSCLVHEPTLLHTVLGSCVGITFWSRHLGIAALCHPMLPTCPVKPASILDTAARCRYVDFAVRNLARQFDSLGADRAAIEVKLFGGADVLTVSANSSRLTVGALNAESALRILSDEGFAIKTSCLRGTSGFHIQFHTGTGEVLLRRLS